MNASDIKRNMIYWGDRIRRGNEIRGFSFSEPDFSFDSNLYWKSRLILSYTRIDDFMINQLEKDLE